MKNLNRKKQLIFLIFIFILSSIHFTYAQVKSENTVQTKPDNYEYLVGKKIGTLLKGYCCFVLYGTIQEINDSNATFIVRETLTDMPFDKDRIELTNIKPSSRKFYITDYLPKLSVDFKEGNELIVFSVGRFSEQRNIRFITSYKELFPSIRKSIAHYNNYKQNPEILLEVPNLVKNSDDKTFISYLVTFTSRGGALKKPDDTAIVLSQLLEIDNVPEESMDSVRLSLTGFLVGRKFFPITSATRDTVLRNVIKVGSSDKKLANQAVIILGRVANRNTVDLKPYLNQQNKFKLLEKSNSLPTTYDKEQQKLRNILLDIFPK